MTAHDDAIVLERRPNGSYAAPQPRPDFNPSRSDTLMRRAYWVSGFVAGFFACALLLGTH